VEAQPSVQPAVSASPAALVPAVLFALERVPALLAVPALPVLPVSLPRAAALASPSRVVQKVPAVL
jgi:hypothetical protein